MGLAASQARFLSLTARQTNVEYEGQQINQQRTALANQSAGLYNQMLSLEVPTPPVAIDYSKTVYTFVDVTTSKTITLDSIYKNPVESGSGVPTYTVSGYRKSPSVLSNYSVLDPNTANGYSMNYDSTNDKYTINAMGGSNMSIIGPTTSKALTPYFQEQAAEHGIEVNEDTEYFKFTNPATGVEYYILNEDEKYADVSALYDAYASNPLELKIFSAQSYEKDEFFHVENAQMITANDGTGRYEYITFTPENEDQPITCKLTQLTVQDDDAFDAATETYNAKKIIYDKTMAEINAKTEVIQQQDKNLELHLNQLDTEQQAIQTELQAVKKVIDKNIEETFKTFA